MLPAYEDDYFDLQRHNILIKLQIAFLLLQGGAVANTGVSQQEGSQLDILFLILNHANFIIIILKLFFQV